MIYLLKNKNIYVSIIINKNVNDINIRRNIMKKLITTFAFIALSTVSAKAVDLEIFSVTGGLAANQSVFGATAVQNNRDEANALRSTKSKSGVFTDSHRSQFIELGIGRFISIGYEHTPDSITTPTNTTRKDMTDEANVSVDFNDLNTTYIKINLPGGVYAKAGTVETDLDIKETMANSRTYKNVSTEGTMMGLGYQYFVKDTGFGLRFEGSYLELDNVSTSNGISATGATVANGGRNQIDASNLEGLTGKIALTYTFGRAGNSY